MAALFRCLLLLSAACLAMVFGAVGYAPVPQVAPAPTSYGNPQQVFMAPGQSSFPQSNFPQNTFQTQSRFNQVNPLNNGNGVVGSIPSNAGEDDWDSIITARGVKNLRLLRPNRRH